LNWSNLSFVVSIFLEFWSPESQVVSDQLHDRGGILVLIFFDLIDVSNRIIKGLLGNLAGFARVILDFVEENWVVQGQTQSNWMGGLQVLFTFIGGSLVGLIGFISGLFIGLSTGVFRNVSEIVTLHLVEEDLSVGSSCLGNKLVVEEVDNFITVLIKLAFDLLFVGSKESNVLWSLLLFLLLNWGKGSPSSPSGTNSVLVGNTQQVSLLDIEIGVGSNNSVHALEHIFESLGLLGDLGHIKVFFSAAGSHFKFFLN
jgi:hypothetical protein